MFAFRLRHGSVNSKTPSKTPLRLGEPAPCPYISGRTELQAFAILGRTELKHRSEQMNRLGFRRAMNTAYIPVCPNCRACQSVRVVVDRFQPSKSLRRIMRHNCDVRFVAQPSEYTDENYALFDRYVQMRHPESDMKHIDAKYFCRLITVVPDDAFLLCGYDSAGRLLAVMMVDDFDDGFSGVYSFFDPEMPKRSLGLMMIMELIRRAREAGKPYVYLGYYIAGVSNMAYKKRFAPLEYYDWDREIWYERDIQDRFEN